MPAPPSALIRDAAALGLVRREVRTSVGPLTVRHGRRTHPTTGTGPTGTGRTGTGPTALILLHGAAASWTTWTPLIAASDRRCTPLIDLVLPDLPGWGDSPSAGSIGADAGAAAVVEVARALGYERWVVVGHSLGGFVALVVATAEPVATAAVGLVSGTGAGVQDTLRHPVRAGVRLPWFLGMVLGMRVLAALPGEGRGLLRLLRSSGALGPLASPLLADRRRIDRSVTDALADEVRPAAFAAATRAATDLDTSTWRSIACPVRSVRGARDVFVGRRDLAALEALVPHLVATVLPDAGHFAAVEQPDAVLTALDLPPRP